MTPDDPEAQAGAPGSIELGGEVYAVPQASDSDLMEVRRWLKKHVPGPLEMYSALVADPKFRTLPRKVRDELAAEAGRMKMRGETPLTGELAAEMLQEPEHCAFLAWVLLRQLRPGLKLSDLKPLITQENAGRVFFELHEASGMDSLGN